MNKMIARMICLMLALIMTLCAAMPVLAEGDTGSETATDADSLADALGLTDEERELLTELDPSEKVHIEDGDLSISAELGQGWRNVLLLGNDARSLEGNGRTDTMIIASINQQTASDEAWRFDTARYRGQHYPAKRISTRSTPHSDLAAPISR